MAKRLAVEIENEIVRLYRDEKIGGIEVAKRVGVGTSAIYRVLRRNGVEYHPDVHARERAIPVTAFDDVVRRYLANESAASIAQSYGCNPWTVRNILRQRDITVRMRGAKWVEITPEQEKQMVQMYEVEGISQMAIARRMGLTQPNVSRILRRNGVKPTRYVATGEKHGSWKGGRVKLHGGYWYILVDNDDPLAVMRTSVGYVLEHRLVMARSLGRPLLRSESVHHINGDTGDNRIENLQLRQGKHGTGQVYRCADCGSYHIVSVKIKDKS